MLLKRVICIALFVLAACLPGRAQQKVALSASSTDCSVANSCVSIGLYASGQPGQVDQKFGGATIAIGANASGNTIQFEASADGGATWVAMNMTPSNSTTAATSTTSTGVWQGNVAGYTNIRARMSTLSGGTTTVSVTPSTASARSGGGRRRFRHHDQPNCQRNFLQFQRHSNGRRCQHRGSHNKWSIRLRVHGHGQRSRSTDVPASGPCTGSGSQAQQFCTATTIM